MSRSHRLAGQALSACLAVALLLTPAAQSRAPSRIVAIGDVHGAYSQLVALLQHAGLIDARFRWVGGSASLVQTGDVVDRGARSRDCLDLLMKLEREAPKKGGAVVPLLGNHEVMNMMGELRYVTPEIYRTFASGSSEKRRQQAYQDYLKFLAAHAAHRHTSTPPIGDAERATWMAEHPLGFVEHREAFGPKGKYGQWLRAQHTVVQVGDGAFVHGGLSPAFEIPSIRQLDERVTAELTAFDSIWRALVEGKVIWRYMTLTEAVKFAGEELAWLQDSGASAAPGSADAIRKLLDRANWMVAVFPDGPLWYRGLAEEPEEALGEAVVAMLARFQIRYVVVGHTPQSNSQIVPRFGNRVFLVDTGMLPEVFKGRATALEIRNGHFSALSGDRPPVELPAPPAVSGGQPPGRPRSNGSLTPLLERR